MQLKNAIQKKNNIQRKPPKRSRRFNMALSMAAIDGCKL